MSHTQKVLAAVLLLLAGLGAVVRSALAGTETSVRLIDKQIARVHSGSSDVDVSAAVYTGYVTLLTIAPESNQALYDAQITLDLDFGDSSNGFAGGYTSETIQFAVARKVQGLWRIDDELETATVAGSNAGDRCVTLKIGMVGPEESLRIYVRLSAEQGDITVPYVLYYRSGGSVTVTEVTAG